jgi:nucleotide-binding universal stress UspA family protein
VDQAVLFAEALGAGISAIACEIQIQAPGRLEFITDALLDIPALVAAEIKKSSDHARDLLAAFETAAQKQGLFQERIVERCLTSQVPDVLVEYARLRDLTIVPMPAGDRIERWYAESIIFGAGRPTVVMPAMPERSRASGLGTVAVAWDFSRPAARAVADALPILEQAKDVRVVTITREKAIDSARSAEELAKHLSRHGVSIVVERIDAEGRTIGDALEAYVTSRNADLLVMGAYGHSRIREFILGGATKYMLSRPPLPILFSH